ncbi:Inositol oxygenase 1 [Colletotrichum spinosum]|uniref:Inositol oxygenase n=1 Tax=Colletotrichum spinosum TaxID=1347390 RepID=A0A4R8QIT6_9PEZI|nr:Inositol oxygenase 1 [Colletotrichum spinosum]
MAVVVATPFASRTNGHELEQTTDFVEEVNILKDQLNKQDNGTYEEESKFDADKDKTAFRQYEDACDRVKNFYKEQHEKQTVEYNLAAREKFAIDLTGEKPCRDEMTIWEAMEKLNTLIDNSDPDTELSQIQHLLQTAEAMRRDGNPRWMQLTGLIHDLGKLLFFYGAEGQWDVVGDTFPVGCAFDQRIVLPTTFEANPDNKHPVYSTKHGIYKPGCGIENLMISWGHDEYMYLVCKEQSTLPREALAMIRYHSFYPWHREGAYREFMKEGDEDLLKAVLAFNPYDLYSKNDDAPTVEELKPYYMELIDEYFPKKVIKW